MSTSPPDISSLSLSPQRHRGQQHDSYDQYADTRYHYSTSPPVIPGQYKSQRAGLPSQWLDSSTPPPVPDSRSLSPPQTSDLSSGGGSPPISHTQPQPFLAPGSGPAQQEDEIIPTAIVLKNIPFNVKRETLLDIIASLSIPTPYAFNYHLDAAGSFRGLAFANFRHPADADAVVAALNGFDVQGRKLRVEYKKVLQAGEKERIEREKAIRRMRSMQLEKEQQNMAASAPYDDFGSPGAVTPGRSYPGLASMPVPQQHVPQHNSPPHLQPMPIPQPYLQQPQAQPQPSPVTPPKSATELDLNDPSTLEIYSRILLFKDDRMRDELAFSRTLTPKQRRVVHLVAQKLGVYHYSVGEGDERYAVVTRIDPNGASAPSTEVRPVPRHVSSSQTLSRSFLSPTGSSSGNPFQQGPSGAYSAAALRAKKSMPDMKSLHTPAPRLNTRASNGNIREGYATISSPPRRSPGGAAANFNALFGNGSSPVPPMPTLSLPNGESGGVVRQPRGPGVGGFGTRREKPISSPGDSSKGISGGLDTRSHEPLEI